MVDKISILAQVVEGSLVLDPFCGSASILLGCAALGAATVGIDIDEKVLRGRGDGACIATNFAERGLPPPEALLHGDMASADVLLPPEPGGRYERFDAIVTDPPYGLMEGLGPYYLPLGQRLASLLRLSCRRLRLGGRLVFLLPLPAHADADEAMPVDLPTSRCLLVERISRQRLSLRLHRLLITLVKVAEPQSAEEGLEVEVEQRGQGREGDAAQAAPVAGARPAWVAPWEAWWRTVDALESDVSKGCGEPRVVSTV